MVRAVYLDPGAIDITGQLGAQVHDHAGDLFGAAHPRGRHARVILARLAESTSGLAHVELDVTDRPEIATSLGVLRTPTTVAFTSDGTELLRVGGVPRGDTLIDALRPHLP